MQQPSGTLRQPSQIIQRPPAPQVEGGAGASTGARRKGQRARQKIAGIPIPPLKLRHILFALLLVSGIVPLLISSYHLIGTNQELLESQQKELLTKSAEGYALQLSDGLEAHRKHLEQLGRGLLAVPGEGSVTDRLRTSWAREFLRQGARGFVALRVLDRDGQGLGPALDEANAGVDAVMAEAHSMARDRGEVVYRFAQTRLPSGGQAPTAVIAVPVTSADGGEVLVVEGLVRLPFDPSGDDMFLIDNEGKRLWSVGTRPEVDQALLGSVLVADFLTNRFSISSEEELIVDNRTFRLLARVVPVEAPEWGVVVHKPINLAFRQVQDMVQTTAMTSVVVVALALFFAFIATRWLTSPIQRLTETSHEIAAGNFDRRVPTEGITLEVVDLAEDFNRMSDTVENYIGQLQQAAQKNRQLFISSIRAFAAAIDAKDPYTRGHSERVARYSRAIARYLGLPSDQQERVWISAVLHDVGKIGVEDRVLLKMGRLTDEEFELMKRHPVIGADIVEPISELRAMLPGIRWHHEAWDGSGYPDGIKGEQIPLMARIIGVADTFDAITTNRPYQKASGPDYALQIIKKLTGSRFDAKIVTAFLLAYDAGHIRMDPPAAETMPSPNQAVATG